MNILLWYLPYAMFFGACDVVLSESERSRSNESLTATTSGRAVALSLPLNVDRTIR
jgi:hypothetical protein